MCNLNSKVCILISYLPKQNLENILRNLGYTVIDIEHEEVDDWTIYKNGNEADTSIVEGFSVSIEESITEKEAEEIASAIYKKFKFKDKKYPLVGIPIEGIPLRCMADLIITDHKNKLIIPCDLKTSYKEEWNFYKSFIEWNYFTQANCYSEIIRQNIAKDDYFKDFTILDYRFIVVCNRTRVPLVWEWPYSKTITDFKIGDVKLILPNF